MNLSTYAECKDIRILSLEHVVYLLELDTYFLVPANVMTISIFNPSILDCPPDQVCYILLTSSKDFIQKTKAVTEQFSSQ